MFFDFGEFVLKVLVRPICSIFWYFRGQRSGVVRSWRWYRISEGIIIGVVQSEKCDTGNGTFKQNYFENTLTFVSKPSPDHSLKNTYQIFNNFSILKISNNGT